VVAIAIYTASALLVTWPLARNLTTSIPRGTETAITVPLFNLWTLWWNAAWFGESSGYWNAPIFAPTPAAFALSEPQPTMMTVAPLIWCGGPPALAYNVYLLLALILNGVATSQLLRAAGAGRVGAIAGGLFVQWLPFIQWQIGVLQLVPIFWETWTVLALIRIVERPTIHRGIVLGIAFGLAFWSCENLGLFFAVPLIVAARGWSAGGS
jgi:hypothetical protein